MQRDFRLHQSAIECISQTKYTKKLDIYLGVH